jgi:integrase/recombinase XerC
MEGSLPVPQDVDGAHAWLTAVEPRHTDSLTAWLGRSGRFVNRDGGTNTLAVLDDAQAVALFLRERASRSRPTRRAYAADLRRLIGWYRDRQLGPLLDLTRNGLLAWCEALRMVRATIAANGRQRAAVPGERTQARALAVIASLYQYWFDTGYLIANPAAGLVTGTQARSGFAPQRFLPPAALAACDAWMAATPAGHGLYTYMARAASRVPFPCQPWRLRRLSPTARRAGCRQYRLRTKCCR